MATTMEANKAFAGKETVDCVESEEENISESFICCVCLDLLYKPIVLACGHASCFWCVFKSMSRHRESHCPYCRHPYHHFPTICQMLHILLLKMYPVSYKKRETQILEEEKQTGYFSPVLDESSSGLHIVKKLASLGESEQSFAASSPSNLSSVPYTACEDRMCAKMRHSQSHHVLQDGVRTSATKEDSLSQNNGDVDFNEVSVTDVLCSACKQLIYRPAVLNCGHGYCQTCLIVPEDEIIICQVCESPHTSDFPKVHLQFSKFLEEKFPKEYALRRDFVECILVQFESTTKAAKKGVAPSFLPGKEFLPWGTEDGSNVHYAVGCDSCGVYPIIGDRYKCKDCTEAIGYDLCGDCYTTRSKLPGRFNQQHAWDHQFELLKFVRVQCLRLVTGRLVYGPF
ncbi:hypothetical protein Nepgr_022253 [Nepenthes gracilis]|uniref:E3 ubiquitin-protein ligase PRT1 n=1 Tax=Nepenthes gracilis TaxID=150966 RepID=A0AAD3XWM4_NEPGR|nr:hypothetical protein Nepgr_022253 [Nepenthes gracilis]